EGLVLADLPASDPGPAEATWEQHRRAVLKSALDELPPPQREALSLAFLEDLTHEQVAAELGVPLGTAKTRIRAGLLELRSALGTVEPDAGGSARLVAEDPALAALPDGVEVTLEPRTGSAAPSGPVVVAWVP